MFPKPKKIDEKVIENMRSRIDSTAACVLSTDASVSLSEGAKLHMEKLAAGVIENMHHQA